jgi:hypothetical protein
MVYFYVGQYSFFTSVMTLGGMITAVFSGKISALVGRRQVISYYCWTGSGLSFEFFWIFYDDVILYAF